MSSISKIRMNNNMLMVWQAAEAGIITLQQSYDLQKSLLRDYYLSKKEEAQFEQQLEESIQRAFQKALSNLSK